MGAGNNLLRFITCCFHPSPTTTTTTAASASSATTSAHTTIKNRLSSTFTDLLKDLNLLPSSHHQPSHLQQEDQDSLIDPADSSHPHHQQQRHRHVIGTLYGSRHSHHHTTTVSIQLDPSLPPPFLFDLPLPTSLLAKEMSESGVLRLALVSDCANWTAYCNGRKAGYAARRRPGDCDKKVLDAVKSMSAGAGVLNCEAAGEEVMYMRACYERVVGSRDSVSFHMISPGGGGAGEDQELSIFLLRTG